MGVVEHDVQLRLHQDGDELTGGSSRQTITLLRANAVQGFWPNGFSLTGLLGEAEPCVCFSMLRNRACLSVMFVQHYLLVNVPPDWRT